MGTITLDDNDGTNHIGPHPSKQVNCDANKKSGLSYANIADNHGRQNVSYAPII